MTKGRLERGRKNRGKVGNKKGAGTCMLQFSSEMQQTWHIYRPRDQFSETGIKILILVLNSVLMAP
jgi:hypothetical protein